MRYRVIRDIGNSEWVVGSTFDGAAVPPERLRQLVAQRRIEPIVEPGSLTPDQEAALLGAATNRLAALEAENATLADDNARLQAELDAALAAIAAVEPDEPGGDTTPSGVEMPGESDGPPDPAAELATLTVPELKGLAAERGIEGHASMNKAALIAALAAKEGEDAKPSDQG